MPLAIAVRDRKAPPPWLHLTGGARVFPAPAPTTKCPAWVTRITATWVIWLKQAVEPAFSQTKRRTSNPRVGVSSPPGRYHRGIVRVTPEPGQRTREGHLRLSWYRALQVSSGRWHSYQALEVSEGGDPRDPLIPRRQPRRPVLPAGLDSDHELRRPRVPARVRRRAGNHRAPDLEVAVRPRPA